MSKEAGGKRKCSVQVNSPLAEQEKGGKLIKINLSLSTNHAYYVPVKFGRQHLSVALLDSGCTNSIISRRLLRVIPESACGKTTPFHGYGVLADGTKVDLDERIQL